MALTEDRNTPHQDGKILNVPVAAGVICFAGGIACINAAGLAVPGTATTGLTYLGRFEENVDNHLGDDAAITINIRRKQAFLWANSSADVVTQSALGKFCYIEDGETVSLTDGSSSRSVAGIVIGLDADGVWVE